MPSASIFGCAGPVLDAEERAFFREADPFGFILFARNFETPEQGRALADALRDCVGRDAPILIDQEGGRVARLRPPHWWHPPAAGRFATLAATRPDAAVEAVTLAARLIAAQLRDVGVDVNCVPVLDVVGPDGNPALGDRVYAGPPDQASRLGRAMCEGHLAGGVLPVLKHIPGHGRATADSHFSLPRVDTALEALDRTDLVPFRDLAAMPMAMTAHIVFSCVDPVRPVTQSATAIATLIRGRIGFDGLLMTDDLSMSALSGGYADRAALSLAAGCDVVLHCNGRMDEMAAVAGAAGPLGGAALARAERALAARRPPEPVDQGAALARLNALLGPGNP